MSTLEKEKIEYTATEALWHSAEIGEAHRLESLIAAGADINACNAHGVTALMRAASAGRSPMVRALLDRGANPNACRHDGFTALMLAAFFGHQNVVKVLIEHGADSAAATRFGTSAQMWAAARTYPDVVHYLAKPDAIPIPAKKKLTDSNTKLGPSRRVSVARNESPTPACPVDTSDNTIASTTAIRRGTIFGLTEVRGELRASEIPVENSDPLDSMPFYQKSNPRILIHAVTIILFVSAVIAGWTIRSKQTFPQASRRIDTIASGVVVAPTKSLQSFVEARRMPVKPMDQPDTANTNVTGTPHDVNSKEQDTTRAFASTAVKPRNDSSQPERVQESTRPAKESKKNQEIANAPPPLRLPVVTSKDDVVSKEFVAPVAIPQSTTQTAKSQTPTRPSTQNIAPAPTSTQLLSRSKTSSSNSSRTIQWP